MTWLYTVPPIVLLGFASGWFSGSGAGNAWFDRLAKPSFMPPGWVFPVVWTSLYVLMGIASARIVDARAPGRDVALALFGAQLLLNLGWSPLFFAAHRVRGALALILLLDATVVATIVAFAHIDGPAAAMLLPYVAWLALATMLNAAILRLNR